MCGGVREGGDERRWALTRLPFPSSLEAAAAPQTVVAAAPAGGRPADPMPGVATSGAGAAAGAVPLASPWLPGALAAFSELRSSVLAARDAFTPDPLDPNPPPRPALPANAARPPSRGEPAASWRARQPSALALAAASHLTIVDALDVVADAVADSGGLDAGAALWAFALAANLERPLPAAAAAALASLARAAGRAAVENGGSDAEAAARCAVVAAVAGGYWAQCASLAPAAAEGAP